MEEVTISDNKNTHLNRTEKITKYLNNRIKRTTTVLDITPEITSSFTKILSVFPIT